MYEQKETKSKLILIPYKMTDKKTTALTFIEYWKELKEKDINAFRDMKKEIMVICGIEEYTLRRKRRNNTFSKAEKIVISDIISELENTHFKPSELFPETITINA